MIWIIVIAIVIITYVFMGCIVTLNGKIEKLEKGGKGH